MPAESMNAEQPNILWLVAEDVCPDLGCYGHSDAITPNLDRLAAEGTRFSNAFSFSPVCSPARSCLITGMYPTSLGSQHLRSEVPRPAYIKCFTEYLRDAGYYCFNGFSLKDEQHGTLSDEGYQTKFDYNFTAPSEFAIGGHEDLRPAWDAASGLYPHGRAAHWRNRAPGQPFFGQIGFLITHSSQYGTRHLAAESAIVQPLTRVRPEERRDPANVRVPSYHPQTASIRRLWAEYHECITEMDHQVGEILAALEADGLLENTIVFFFGDNGMGVLGGKCWLWEQGLHVPLIVRCPERFSSLVGQSPGTVDERLISFEDFAPTVLRLAGLTPPAHMQGHGFLGDAESNTRSREYVYGIRDRIDHCPEVIRSVRSRQYQYVRNFMPHIGWNYSMFFWRHAPDALADWQELSAKGRLEGRQRVFFQKRKPVEELYDLQADPDQMRNLAADPHYASVLETLRTECEAWMIRTGDLGLLSEHDMHERANGSPPFETGQNPDSYPVADILAAARLAGNPDADQVGELVSMLDHCDAGVRRWAAIGLNALGVAARPALPGLCKALTDASASVRIVAAEAAVRLDSGDEGLPVLLDCLQHDSGLVAFEALWALDRLGPDAIEPIRADLDKVKLEPRETWLERREPHLPVMMDAIRDRLQPGTDRAATGALASLYKTLDYASIPDKYLD